MRDLQMICYLHHRGFVKLGRLLSPDKKLSEVLLKIKRHRKQYCPGGCGYRVDAMSGAGHDHLPTKGDFSICFNCYAILRVEKGFRLRLSTLAEAEADESGLRQKIESAIAAAKLLRVKKALNF